MYLVWRHPTAHYQQKTLKNDFKEIISLGAPGVSVDIRDSENLTTYKSIYMPITGFIIDGVRESCLFLNRSECTKDEFKELIRVVCE